MTAARLAVVALAVVLTGAVATAAVASPAQQAPPRKPDVDELLERFPIGTETVNEAESQAEQERAAAPPATGTALSDDSGGDSPWTATVGVIGAVLVALMASAVVLLHRRRRRPSPVWSTTPNLRLLSETLALSNEEWDNLHRAEASRRRSTHVSEASQDRDTSQPARARDKDGPLEFQQGAPASAAEQTGVVERISAILQAAESAAAAIRAEAEAAAEEIKSAAAAEGEQQLARVEKEADRIRSSAEEAANEALTAAESYSASQRREAERRVEETLAQAEEQARSTREAAEEMARQIEQAAREREEVLRAQMQPLETSLRRALDAFRGISAQLEELLDETRREDETLVQALSGQVRSGTGEWEETAPPEPRRKR
jgi:hypothetical protein